MTLPRKPRWLTFERLLRALEYARERRQRPGMEVGGPTDRAITTLGKALWRTVGYPELQFQEGVRGA